MRIAFLILFFASTLRAEPLLTPLLQNGANITFFADSWGSQYQLPNYIQAYFATRYPTRTNNWLIEGNGGEQIAGYVVEYDRHVIGHESSVLFLLGTFNGTISSNDFRSNVVEIVGKAFATNESTSVLLGVGPKNTPNGGLPTGFDRSYAHESVAIASNLLYYNMFASVGPALSNNYAAGNIPGLHWDDTQHPGEDVYAFMAYSILTNFQEDGFVSEARIDVEEGGSVVSSSNCTIGSLVVTASGLSFTRLDTKLPMPVDLAASNAFVFCEDMLTNFNRMYLIVSNLTAGTYRVTVDNVATTNITAELLEWPGLNIAELCYKYAACSYSTQLVEVLGLTRDKVGRNRANTADLGPPNIGMKDFKSRANTFYAAGDRGEALIANLAPYRANLIATNDLLYAAAQPIARSFSIVNTNAAPYIEPAATRMAGRARGSGNARIQ